jgi:hypothetical protein
MADSTGTPVTIEDVDALLSGATPQFSMQIKSRLHALVADLPADDEVRRYGEQQMELLDHLALGTTRGQRSPGRPALDEEGWQSIPSHPAGGPLDRDPATRRR